MTYQPWITRRARTPAQKRQVLDRIYDVWIKTVDMRLGQFLEAYGIDRNQHIQFFDVEDFDLIDRLEMIDTAREKAEAASQAPSAAEAGDDPSALQGEAATDGVLQNERRARMERLYGSIDDETFRRQEPTEPTSDADPGDGPPEPPLDGDATDGWVEAIDGYVVEYYYDPTARRYGYSIPEVNAHGDGGRTRSGARALARKGLAFAREDTETEVKP